MNIRLSKIFRVVGLGLIILVAACSLPTSVPVCPSDLLMEPHLLFPYNWSTVYSLTPILDWGYPPSTYPYPYPSGECRPDQYHVTLKTGPMFTDELGTTIGGETSKWKTSTLQTGTEYEWTVRAVIGAEESSAPSYYHFFTGPLCTTDMWSVATPLEPANGATVDTVRPLLIWDDPSSCLSTGWEVQISGDPTFTYGTFYGYVDNPSTRWQPGSDLEDCSTYYWRVRQFEGGLRGSWSSSWSFRVETGTVFCFEPLGPVYEYQIPHFIPDTDAHCRLGPGSYYPIRSSLTAGMVVPIIGQNQAGDWYFVQLPDDNLCWVSSQTGSSEGDVTKVQVLPDPATPTFTPVPTATFTPRPDRINCGKFSNDKACNANAACQWVQNPSGGGGYCTNR